MEQYDTVTKMPYRDSLVSFIDSLVDMAKDDELKNIMIVGQTAEGEVVTGSSGLNYADKMALIGHLQARLMDERYGVEPDPV